MASQSDDSKDPYSVRAARPSDLPQINDILTHYIENTIITFRTEPMTLEQQRAGFDDVIASSLPYLVAVEHHRLAPAPTSTASAEAIERANERIICICYAHPFRGVKGGYGHTAELTLFCAPDATNRGVGTRTLSTLIDELRKGGKIKQFLSCMSIDPDEVVAEKLKRFYERFGFEERGRLKKVGFKLGKWIDTRYMQLEL